ncbi:TadE/TadG family type IV pilus assembly protein [Parerythrobacter jejuensis]|uniref:Pilus assembly protein n=1 Tax=Parerythrobacter jejuensis TaxID=795812 RepID=A0A845AUB3_9SPHN|nr:TadE/TadG family type IV pilus assembly protein [Parerythrobacter jejuensis]MXP32763.1 pilus assembly protein [Parerythrobacter jejuensis]
MSKLTSLLRDIARDQTGVTVIEFGYCMPIFAIMLMGMFDVGFQIYAGSVLQGAVQAAARASTLESGGTNANALDTMVTDRVQQVIPGATLTFTRKNYATFSDVGLAEDFTDTVGAEDGICNNGEPFEDLNGNGNWDADRGADGLGGARDAVLYGATATFDRVFPFHEFAGIPAQITIDSSTVLRNQPFNEQGSRDPVIGACT